MTVKIDKTEKKGYPNGTSGIWTDLCGGEVSNIYPSTTNLVHIREYLSVTSHNSPVVTYTPLSGLNRGQLLRRLRLKSNPYDKDYFIYQVQPLLGTQTWKVGRWCKRTNPIFAHYCYYTTYFSSSYVPSLGNRSFPLTSPAYYEAVRSFYKDINNVKLNIGVAFRERKQTIDLVASTATRIYRAYREVRKGNLTGASSIFGHPGRKVPKRKRLADQWLEYQFGWVPLYNDIYGAMILTAPRPPKIPVKVSRQHHSTDSIGFANYDIRDRVTIKCFVEPEPGYNYTVHELGLDNPALIVWETIPFSFVFDWFLPVGDWLESQTALFGVVVSDLSVTKTRKMYISTNESFQPSVPSQYTVSQWPTVSGSSIRKTRELGSIPNPVYPKFKNPFSVSHAISAVSLLVSRKKLT